MNMYISKTIKASVVKFSKNVSYNCTQKNYVLELGHALCRSCKSTKYKSPANFKL